MRIWCINIFFYRHVKQLQISLLFCHLKIFSVASLETVTPSSHCEKDSCVAESRVPVPGNLVTVAMTRTVTKVVPSKEQDEGMGARVRRSIGGSQVFR